MALSMKALAAAAIVTLGLAGVTAAQTATTTATAPTTAAATAAPAAPTPALTDLTLELGLTADMIARGQQLQADMVKFGYDEDDVDDWCVGKRDIRSGLIRAGFNDMDVVDRMTDFRVRVEALYLPDGFVYSMLVNRCTGEVSRLAPIYMAAELA